MNPLATARHRNLAPVDLVIIGVYFFVVFSIGLYFARKERTSTDYFLASRDIGWFFIGASLFVSNISTEHFIGLSGTNQEQVRSRTHLGPMGAELGNLGKRYAF
jgi:Sodium:solute symporter family